MVKGLLLTVMLGVVVVIIAMVIGYLSMWVWSYREQHKILGIISAILEILFEISALIPITIIFVWAGIKSSASENQQIVSLMLLLGIIGGVRVSLAALEMIKDELKKPYIEQGLAWGLKLKDVLLLNSRLIMRLFGYAALFGLYVIVLDFSIGYVLDKARPISIYGIELQYIPIEGIGYYFSSMFSETHYGIIGLLVSIILISFIYFSTIFKRPVSSYTNTSVSESIEINDFLLKLNNTKLIGIDSLKMNSSIVWLKGEVGTGKTVLSMAIIGEIPPKFEVEGNINRPESVVHIPQEPAVALPYYLTINQWKTILGLSEGNNSPFDSKYPKELSSGERRKIFLETIDMLIKKESEKGNVLVIMDEPESSLDLCNLTGSLKQKIEEWLTSNNVRILYISHRDYFARLLSKIAQSGEFEIWEINSTFIQVKSSMDEKAVELNIGQLGEEKDDVLISVEEGNYTTYLRNRKEIKIKVSKGYDIRKREIVFVFGHNGGGKTTLLKAIKGLVKINPEIESTVQNSEIVLFLDSSERAFEHTEKVENAVNMLKKVWKVDPIWGEGNQYLKDKRFGELSGGEKEKLLYDVILNMAFRAGFKVILLDEPFSKLSKQKMVELYNRILELNKKRDISIVIVSHHLMAYIKGVGNMENAIWIGEKSRENLQECAKKLEVKA